MTLYFKRHWNETTGDEPTDTWGTSDYYFETDEEGNVLKQLQIFVNGNCLKYDLDYLDDKYGGISEVPLDLSEFKEFQISEQYLTKFGKTPRTQSFQKLFALPIHFGDNQDLKEHELLLVTL